MQTVTIPFSGFYCSTHETALDSALEQMFSDDSGYPIDSILQKAQNCIDWRVAHLAYAQLYANNLSDETGITWKFAKLDSPRFYNYRNDEIEVEITETELRRIFDECDKQSLAAIVSERLKPRSGFVPFYSDKLADWPDTLEQWETVQLSLLMESYCDEYVDSEARDYYMIDDSNGELTAVLESSIPADMLESLYSELESHNEQTQHD